MVDLFQLHLAKHKQALVELVRVEHGYVFFYVPLTLQAFLPLKHGSGGEMNSIGQLFRSEFAVFLEYS